MDTFETMTIYHLRDLATGRRMKIMSEDVRVFQVPHYEGLTMADLLGFANRYELVMRALPSEPREITKLHRAYVANVIYTVVGDDFREWVLQQIQIRNRKVQEQNNMVVHLDPEIARIFHASTSVSGKLVHMSWSVFKLTFIF